MKLFIRKFLPLAVVLLAGCTNPYYHERGSFPGGWLIPEASVDYVATDAKQRIVNYINVPEGKFDEKTRSIRPQKLICAEPSPDVASAFSYAVDAALKYNNGKTDASVGLNATFSESLMQLGKRIATVQLLRDELADLCRSYANGAITGASYTIRLSRLDKKMVTLLASEAAAGAISDSGKALAGNATLNKAGDPESVNQAKADAEKASAEVKVAAADLSSAPDDTKKANLNSKMAALDKANAQLASAALSNALKSLSSGAQLQSGGVTGNVSFTVTPEVIEDIQDNFMRVDDASTIIDTCLTNMTENGGDNTEGLKIIAALVKNDSEKKMIVDEISRRIEKLPENEKHPVTLSFTKLFKEYKQNLKSANEEKDAEEITKYKQNVEILEDMIPLLNQYVFVTNSMASYCQASALPAMFELMKTQAAYRKDIELKKLDTANLLEIRKAEALKAQAETDGKKLDAEAKKAEAVKAKADADIKKAEADKANADAKKAAELRANVKNKSNKSKP